MVRSIATAIALGLAVCACGPQRSAVDPPPGSGVTSSNGGGQRATGATPDATIGGNSTATQQSPNTRGPAY